MNSRIKITILCIVAFLGHLIAIAQSVTKEQATRIAIQYANQGGCKSAPRIITSSTRDRNKGVDTTITRIITFAGNVPLYLVEPKEGWVLVSSEMAATPILASSPTGKFPEYNDMPESMKWLMSYYEDALQYARDSLPASTIDSSWINTNRQKNVSSTREVTVGADTLKRMGMVQWGQSTNNNGYCYNTYNKFCPDWYPLSCRRTYVGCTAVALGQVMWYWQWPHSAIIPDSIKKNGDTYGGEHLAKYDWTIMPTGLYDTTNITSANAIAWLLRDCGYACKMKYDSTGSYASLFKAKDALLNSFKYKNIDHWYRFLYWADWTGKIKSEIDAGRPVIYCGYKNANIGHTFVVYGYDTDNKFYINWGYRGKDNAAYSLDALNPATIKNGPFNLFQEVLWGIEPDYPDCESYSLTNNDINNNPFEVYNSGSITAQNKTISADKTGIIYSGQSITILPPFTIERGANVHLAIKPPFCDLTQMNAPRNMYVSSNDDCVTGTDVSISRNDGFAISPNPVNAILHIQTTEELAQVKIYNLNGQCVLQSAQTDIDVSALPQGMYILRAVTIDSIPLQAKFIKQ